MVRIRAWFMLKWQSNHNHNSVSPLKWQDLFVAGGKICFISFVMVSFENQIITAIKKIRNANRRPDAEKIFITITKESASNLTLDDVQQKLHEMQSSSKLRNTPYQSLDSYYLVQSGTGDAITSSGNFLWWSWYWLRYWPHRLSRNTYNDRYQGIFH